jgi:hypothetical protein
VVEIDVAGESHRLQAVAVEVEEDGVAGPDPVFGAVENISERRELEWFKAIWYPVTVQIIRGAFFGLGSRKRKLPPPVWIIR